MAKLPFTFVSATTRPSRFEQRLAKIAVPSPVPAPAPKAVPKPRPFGKTTNEAKGFRIFGRRN